MTGMIQEKTHTLYAPNKLLFGLGAARGLAAEVQILGGRKVLVVTDPGVVKAGLLQPALDSLDGAGIPHVLFDQVEPEPPARAVDLGAERAKAEGCDLILGIGGGSSLDVAKGVALMAANPGRILEYCGMELIRQRGLPKILMPTTAGTGSEVTRVFVLTDEAEHTKKAVYSTFALSDVAIVDPLLTLSMPQRVTADTGIDALVHAVETYVSMNATPFSHVLAEKAISLIARYLPAAWSKGSNLEARYQMSLAATLAGLAFASGGLGAVHGLSYPLGTEYHMSHGRSNAILLPHIMRFNVPGNPERFAAIASLMGRDVEGLPLIEAAELAAVAVQELLETIRVPYRLREYGIPEDALPVLVAGGMKQARLFVPNPRDLSEEDVRSIFQEAW